MFPATSNEAVVAVPVNVGEADNTTLPEPVEPVTPVPPLATDNVPVVPAIIGNPVQVVNVPLAGVPNVGVVNTGDVNVLLVNVSVDTNDTKVEFAPNGNSIVLVAVAECG